MAPSNPFAPYFDRIDGLFPRFESGELTEEERPEFADLVRRALFFLVNHLNSQANLAPTLFLPAETLDRTEGTSPTPPEEG